MNELKSKFQNWARLRVAYLFQKMLSRACGSAILRRLAPHRSLAVRVLQDEENLQEVLKESAGKTVVLNWTAAWCGPCKRIAPLVDQMSEDYSNVFFLKVDVDVHMEAAHTAGIQAMPTFQFLQNEKLVAQFAGADPNQLKKILDSIKNQSE
jgi:thioredoxin 1